MEQNISTIERPPVVVVLGHVDHGKSSLLDYIRKTNIVGGEAGGITQHTAAYEVTHKDDDGKSRRITFIDTPGHAAFSKMRVRGAGVADIAILVVAADDGVKPQTLEAIEAIKQAQIPFIVALNKIDKPSTNIERTKQGLAEAGVYVEGYGGDVPVTEISAKTGAGIDALLSLILLSASLEELKTDPTKNAWGVIIEAHRDPKKGILVTLVILDGTLRKGEYLVTGLGDITSIRTLINTQSISLGEAVASTPVQVSGFTTLPLAGEKFYAYKNKKDAEIATEKMKSSPSKINSKNGDTTVNKEIIIPVVLKADTAGTLEALVTEITAKETEKVGVKLVDVGVGTITETDIKVLRGSDRPFVLGFNVNVDRHAKDSAEKNGVKIMTFDIIYKLTEWLEEYIKSITPKVSVEEIIAEAKVLKVFSKTRDRQVLGGIVKSGTLEKGYSVRVKRIGEILGNGKIVSLQRSRNDTDKVPEGEQFGAIIESKIIIAEGDALEIISKS